MIHVLIIRDCNPWPATPSLGKPNCSKFLFSTSFSIIDPSTVTMIATEYSFKPEDPAFWDFVHVTSAEKTQSDSFKITAHTTMTVENARVMWRELVKYSNALGDNVDVISYVGG